MNLENFWISQDGVVLSQQDKKNKALELTIAFDTRDGMELEFVHSILDQLQFSERSRLARAGIELFITGPVRTEKNRLVATAQAFVIDRGFPTYACFRKLLRPGIAIGRLFYAPKSAKLTSTEIWEAIESNQIKLPDTLSIDRFGKAYFTPHRLVYSMPENVSEVELLCLVTGERPRSYLDKLQTAREVEILSVPPGSGLLTSCSMYLPNHYVVLKRGSDHFGLHTGAVLLDPIKTFGSNVMLEIYNSSDQMVVNPVVSIEIFRAPPVKKTEIESLQIKRQVLHREAARVYEKLGSIQPSAESRKVRPLADISLRGQSAYASNKSAVLDIPLTNGQKTLIPNGFKGYDTVAEALKNADPKADSIVTTFFPNLSEHIEILSRSRRKNLKRLVFRQASRNNGFFLPGSAHSQLRAYEELGLKVYWQNEQLEDIYVHTYKKNCGFFIREELVRRFQASTVVAFYGSGVTLKPEDQDRIERLIRKMVEFFGSSMGILTGGGDGAMAVATTAGRARDTITGACFLELEAQLPNFNVDFFNSFQETSRHNRQKWFEVADFCIFNVGGVGTLEEAGIELCNLKLGIRPRVPLVFFSDGFWSDLQTQVETMVKTGRTPAWVRDHLLFSNNPDEVIDFYRQKLQIL